MLGNNSCKLEAYNLSRKATFMFLYAQALPQSRAKQLWHVFLDFKVKLEMRGSKGVRLDPFDTCYPTNTTTSKLQRLEQQPRRQTTTDPEAEVGRGYSYTSAAYLHPSPYKLKCKLSSLPGSVLAGPFKKKKNQSYVPGAGRMRSTKYQGCSMPSTDHALRGPGVL